jgi:signal transduction histidine kinase
MNRVQVLYDSMKEQGRIKLAFEVKQPDLEIYADQNMISQVLLNLVRNALEANEDNSDGKILLVAGTDNSQRPEICVIDNGPGIPDDNLDKIFVPFFTTRQNGSGIGLSISKQIMRAHGGNLKVRSVPGKETVFCLSF